MKINFFNLLEKFFITLLILSFVACTRLQSQESPPLYQPISILSTPSGMFQMKRGLMTTFEAVSFEVDKVQLTAGAQNHLNEIADFIHHVPYAVAIEGHTDNTGDASYNQQLSEQRALAIQNILIARGIDPARLRATGYGESHPIANNQNNLGRQQNRRVEIIILNR